MITKMLLLLARVSLGGRLLAVVDLLHSKTVGRRTEILVALEAAVEGVKLLGLLDAHTADAIKIALLGAIGPTLAEKIGRVQDQIESVVPAPSTSPPSQE